jgi:hypothetical protein
LVLRLVHLEAEILLQQVLRLVLRLVQRLLWQLALLVQRLL